ncbi:hypothetical protein D1007_24454 [Hordeum vulgare]|nr:hypothetical protein D1007_24454 [Hordeum vulgare]
MASMRRPQPQDIAKASISALVISLPIIYVSLLRVPPSALARDSTFWFLMSHSIIAIIAADSGVLFFSSGPHHQYAEERDNLTDVVLPGAQPAATAQEDYSDATSVPLMEAATPIDISTSEAVGGGDQLPTGTGMEERHALALTEGEGAAIEPKNETDHASLLQKRDEEEEASVVAEPVIAEENDAMMVKGDQWTTPQAQITVQPDDQDEGSAEVAREEMKKPQCWDIEETDKPPPQEEEREYWQLSDEELNRKVEEFITRFNRDMVQQEAAVC